LTQQPRAFFAVENQVRAELGSDRFDGHLDGGVLYSAVHLEKTKDTERQETQTVESSPVAQTRRNDKALRGEAVEHWIKSGENGTRTTAELRVNYPSLKDWKRRHVVKGYERNRDRWASRRGAHW